MASAPYGYLCCNQCYFDFHLDWWCFKEEFRDMVCLPFACILFKLLLLLHIFSCHVCFIYFVRKLLICSDNILLLFLKKGSGHSRCCSLYFCETPGKFQSIFASFPWLFDSYLIFVDAVYLVRHQAHYIKTLVHLGRSPPLYFVPSAPYMYSFL